MKRSRSSSHLGLAGAAFVVGAATTVLAFPTGHSSEELFFSRANENSDHTLRIDSPWADTLSVHVGKAFMPLDPYCKKEGGGIIWISLDKQRQAIRGIMGINMVQDQVWVELHKKGNDLEKVKSIQAILNAEIQKHCKL